MKLLRSSFFSLLRSTLASNGQLEMENEHDFLGIADSWDLLGHWKILEAGHFYWSQDDSGGG